MAILIKSFDKIVKMYKIKGLFQTYLVNVPMNV